jgi:PAS domain S-box-containing protein
MRDLTTLLLIGTAMVAAVIADVLLTPTSHLPLVFGIPILIAAHRWPPLSIAATTVIAILLSILAAGALGFPPDTTLFGLIALPFIGYLAILFSARRQAAEAAAAAAQERAAELAAALMSSPDGIIIYDPAGAIVRLNPAAERILGYSHADLERPFAERIAKLRIERPDGKPFPLAELPPTRALRGETVQGVVAAIHPPTGRTVWVSASAAPIRTPDGRLLGAVLGVVDITEQRELLSRS